MESGVIVFFLNVGALFNMKTQIAYLWVRNVKEKYLNVKYVVSVISGSLSQR